MSDQIEATINGIIDSAQNYASSAVTNADDALSRAMSGFITLSSPPPINIPPISPTKADAPGAPNYIYTAPIIGSVPAAPAINEIFIPDLSPLGEPPVLDLSTIERFAPTPFTVSAPSRPGGIDDPLDSVSKPSILAHAAPVLDDIVVPDAPVVPMPATPVIAANAPGSLPGSVINSNIGIAVGESSYELELVTDSDAPVVAIFDKAYNSALPVMRQNIDRQVETFIDRFAPGSTQRMVELEGLIDVYLDMNRENNTGLPDKVEQAIYDRARSRARKTAVDATKQALKETAARGFKMPSGVLIAALDRAHQDESSKNSEVALTVMAQQADLEQKNIQFAITTATALRTSVRQAGISYAQNLVAINGQATEYANKIADTLVSTYEEYRKYYSMQLEYVRILSDQYKLEINAALAQVDIYKSELEGVKIKSGVRKDDVELYNSLIRAEESKIRMYAEELRALSVEIQKRSLTVDMYGKDVQAYSVQAAVKESEVKIYESTLKGDRAKVDLELSRLEEYSIKAKALESQSSSIASIANAEQSVNQNIIESYRASISGFSATLDAEKAKAEIPLIAHRANLEAYKTEIMKIIADNKAEVDIAEVNMKTESRKQILDREAWNTVINALITQMNTNARTGVAAGQVYTSLASSALGAQNTVVNLAHRREEFQSVP